MARRSSGARQRRTGRRSFISRSEARETSHTSLDSFLNSLPPGDGFGDNHRVRATGSSRIVFQNINGVPDDPEDVKQQQLHLWWRSECVDVALLAEMNKFWPSVPHHARWRERLRSAASSGVHSVVSYNEHQRRRSSHNTTQYGGCSATALNLASHAVKISGADSLGRFAWIRFQGRKHKTTGSNAAVDHSSNPSSRDLVIISAYRPNLPSAGKETVWFQQMAHFSRTDRDIDPREAFVVDLLELVEQWIDDGCEVIVGLDANENLSNAGPRSFRSRFLAVGLQEVILSRHRQNFQATYQRNRSNIPIDGLFATGGVPVLAAGYYPFDEHAPSDHRALWVDIDWNKVLGRHRPSSRSFHPRRLTLDNQRVVEKYIRLAEAEYRRFNVAGRLAELMSSIYTSFGLTTQQQRIYNRIHEDAYTARRLAEKKCRKLKMGAKEWSPQGQELWDRISLWKLLLKGRRLCRVSSRKVRRLMKKVGEPMAWTLSVDELEARRHQDSVKHKALHRTPVPRHWRKQHITVTIAAAKRARKRSDRQSTKVSQIRTMKSREETRRRRKARNKGFSGGLRAIQVDTGSHHRVTLTDRHLVENGCMQENTARYQQTFTPHATPPMSSPLYPMFTGPSARSNSESLLRGSLSLPTGLPQPTQAFLRQCRYPSGFSPTPLQVTFEDHVAFWQKNSEKRGSEPHGLHNGHFKAATQSDLLASCDAAFREIPLSTGFTPDQWLHLMNFAIEKKPGDFRLSKMRTIQMMNSEFQANNKLIGKRSMAYAESRNLIPPGQCGARKRHQAIDLALSKRLVWDSLILDRQAAGWVSNDAKSCFDRIVHWVAKLALMRFSIPWEAVSLVFDVLAKAKHRVRTGFGDSPRVFSPTTSIPFQGCGQGNGAGPAIWVALSAILIDMMDAEGFGYSSRTALSDDEIFASCFAFIDDTDVIESGEPSQSAEELMPSIRSALQLWSGGVRATGGAINPEKSFWWLIDFSFDSSSGQWRFRRKATLPGELQLEGLTGRMESLRRLQPDEAERTLGVMMAPLDTGAPQLGALKALAKEWSDSLRPQCVVAYDVFPLIRTTVMKSLEYPMPLTTLSQKEWLDIISPILMRCLPKAGVCRSFKRLIVLAPLRYQGLGLPNPFSLQVFHHLSMLLRHSVNSTQTGIYLRSTLESHQLETGSSFGLLQQQFDNTGILASDTWVKRVWRELDQLDIRVEISSPPLDLYCAGDRLLTDVFVDALVDQSTLLWLNWCRTFLRVTTVSDIVTANGLSITRSAWEGRRSPNHLENYNWPRTVRPSATHWITWRSILTETLLCPGSNSQRRLAQPLGPWHDSLDRWRWLYSESESLVLCRSFKIWQCYRPLSRRTRSTFRRFPRLWADLLPSDCQRVTVEHLPRTGDILLTGKGVSAADLPDGGTTSVFDTWRQWRSECTADWGWVPDSLHLEGSEAELIEALRRDELRMVSDGSYKESIGTAATQIRPKHGTSVLWIRTRTPGPVASISSYRSELIGLLSGVLAVSWLRSRLTDDTQNYVVRCACDGKEALRRSFEDWPLPPTSSDFDVISSIRAASRDLLVEWRPQHVNGHADRYKSWQEMTWWERRNFEVDEVAQSYADSFLAAPFTPPPNPKFFSEPCAIYFQDSKISTLSFPAVDEVVLLPALREYWSEKGRLSPEVFDLVQWSTMEKAMKGLPAGIQRWVSKHTTGMCGVAKFRQRWGLDNTDLCPLCGKATEDHRHVPRCPSLSATTQWHSSLCALQEWFDASNTSPPIADFVVSMLSSLRRDDWVPPTMWYRFSSSDRLLFDQARADQLRIGAQCLIEGLLASQWAPLQQRYFRSLGSRRSGAIWASNLSQQLILIGFQMWTNRNSVFHSDDNVAALAERNVLDSRIRDEFRAGSQGLPSHIRPLLRSSHQAIVLRFSNDDKVDWLQTVQSARRRARRSLNAQKRVLRDFFLPPS